MTYIVRVRGGLEQLNNILYSGRNTNKGGYLIVLFFFPSFLGLGGGGGGGGDKVCGNNGYQRRIIPYCNTTTTNMDHSIEKRESFDREERERGLETHQWK